MSYDFSQSMSAFRKANKDHVCDECETPIIKGESYEWWKQVGKFEGEGIPFNSKVSRYHIGCLDKYRDDAFNDDEL